MNKRVRLILVAVVILVALGFGIKAVFKQPFRYAGTLEATKVDLSSQLPSTIAEVKKQEGEHVSSQEELVDLTCDDIKIAADLAKTNFERGLRLFKAGNMSQETWDQ